jgi:hypothetical protein
MEAWIVFAVIAIILLILAFGFGKSEKHDSASTGDDGDAVQTLAPGTSSAN